MSIKVGLSHSEDDIDIQGEIDFDFFDSGEGEKASNKLDVTQPVDVNDVVSASSLVIFANPDQADKLKQSSSVENGSAQTTPNAEQNATNSSQMEHDEAVSMETQSQSCVLIDTPVGDIAEAPITSTYALSECTESCTFPKVDDANDEDGLESAKQAEGLGGDDNIDLDENGESLSSSVSVTDSDDLSSLTGDSLGALSDSESITDVTPLHSPYYCDSPIPQPRPTDRVSNLGVKDAQITRPVENKHQSTDSEKSDLPKKKENVKFPGDSQGCSKSCSSLDLDLVVEAIKHLEVQSKHKNTCPRQCITPPLTKARKNMSFSNDEVRRIDRDNQLLLKKILSHQGRPKSGSVGQMIYSHRASSAINRQKQQKQIEMENLALLKRIELAKPSKDLCRDHLLRDYNRLASVRHGSRPLSRPSSVIQQPSTSLSGSIHSSRSSSLSSLQSGTKSLDQMKSPAPMHSRVRNIRGLNGKLSHSSSSSPM